MRKLRHSSNVILLLFCAGSFAQYVPPTIYPETERTSSQQLQHDLMLLNIQAETDRLTRATEKMRQELRESTSQEDIRRFNLWMSNTQAETDRSRQVRDQMRMAAEQRKRDNALEELTAQRLEAEETANQKVQDMATDLEGKLRSAEIRAANVIYSIMAAAILIGFGVHLAYRKRTHGIMKYEEKFGVIFMLGSLLLSLLAVAVSTGWSMHLDSLQNVMITLRLSFFEKEQLDNYLIDVPTKYVLMGLVTMFFYGFTTFLGITRPWKSENPRSAKSLSVD